LAPYRDDPATFDNRFVAKLPLDVGWKALGVQHVLYVRPEGAPLQELDDLNEDFVALDRAGIDVKILPLSDFTRVVAHDAPASAIYHYGGSPHGHLHFWPRYGWYEPPRGAARISPAPLSQPVSPGPSYRPTPRPTIFASRSVGGGAGIGKQKPSGFGRVSVRYQASSGGFAGLGPRRGGGNAGRSGSFGRSRSSWSG
jgi:hypothetical protein